MPAPEVDVPLFNGVYKNVDESTANDRSFVMINGILDADVPSMFSRPGLSLAMTLTNPSTGVTYPIDGHFFWRETNILVMISGGRIWYSTDLVSATMVATGDVLNVG